MTEVTDREFTAFVNERGDALLRVAYALAGNQHGAEDLLQNALSKAYARWPRIRGDAEPYVRRILYTARPQDTGLLDLVTGNVRWIRTGPASMGEGSWSPDGGRFLHRPLPLHLGPGRSGRHAAADRLRQAPHRVGAARPARCPVLLRRRRPGHPVRPGAR
ncbi:sigma factor [Micromonospora sagamiensis]|uniref:Sigma-70-like protein n=1 Tax=Micromonospora sagamiensis TaxID=47875 RepID=A0A562WP45_9ACTN|nr:sigma factor [Micromonospora sagamiensis]TWJ32093.1 sigma-70-like protein [Micromonospora sagamiensis]